MRKKIILATFGSRGDLHPYLAIARGLQARGHWPVLVTSRFYQGLVEGAGIDFHASPPDQTDFAEAPEKVIENANTRDGSAFVLRELILPFVCRSYEALAKAAAGAHFIVSHPLAFAAPVVAEKLALPWAGVALSPRGLFSAYDPPLYPPATWLLLLRRLGPLPYRALFAVMSARMQPWAEPVRTLRRHLQLPKPRRNPIVRGQFSPYLNLALFPSVLGKPQPDWPPRTTVTGYPFWGEEAGNSAFDTLLDSGPAPILFTLGSSGAAEVRRFFEESLKAAARMGQRAVLVVGSHAANRTLEAGEHTAIFDYVPYEKAFSRAVVVVHAGGIGATSECLRAGKAALIVPQANDQPDNARRVLELGAGLSIASSRYDAASAQRLIERLLREPAFANTAAQLRSQVLAQDGVDAACSAIEQAC